MLKLLEQYKFIILMGLVSLIGIGSFIYKPNTEDGLVLEMQKSNLNEEIDIEESEVNSKDTLRNMNQARELVPIYICGAVKNPDVYYIDSSAIIKDVVKMAGGFTQEANVQCINLAGQVTPNGKIIVPKIGEEIDKNLDSYENSMSVNVNQTGESVNINTASIEELQQLQGIGEKKATAIKDYRDENGGFKAIEELTEVDGIGDKTFENIKDKVIIQ
ncbi:helix-hairpin-helix domain-containing protein [Cellulosilyticum ruminicola]|uniref:helix-hairpin-helix domain-containing protein n=1 Tax=Cellulosilyticum ruminicola TaxID=425254 RepID=UPI0006CF8531|nr:helix-hairpin-helix domain-containing protein [Cellulosilyticum ruminicola]